MKEDSLRCVSVSGRISMMFGCQLLAKVGSPPSGTPNSNFVNEEGSTSPSIALKARNAVNRGARVAREEKSDENVGSEQGKSSWSVSKVSGKNVFHFSALKSSSTNFKSE